MFPSSRSRRRSRCASSTRFPPTAATASGRSRRAWRPTQPGSTSGGARRTRRRTPRFDRYPFPGCTSQAGSIDIGFVRLPHDTAYYRSPDMFRLLNDDLVARFPSEPEDDRLLRRRRVGGRRLRTVAEQRDPRRPGRHLLRVPPVGLRPHARPAPARARVVAAHELIHNFGALSTGAPHACPEDDGHPCDSTSDILYPFLDPTRPSTP